MGSPSPPLQRVLHIPRMRLASLPVLLLLTLSAHAARVNGASIVSASGSEAEQAGSPVLLNSVPTTVNTTASVGGTRENSHATFLREHEGHDIMHADLFRIMVGTLAVCQISLLLWKLYYPRSYQRTTMYGLWFVPFFVAIKCRNYPFLSVWAVFTVACIFLLALAKEKPLRKNTPKYTYRSFMVVHTITSKLGVFSATLSLAHLVLVHHFPGMLSDMMLEYYLVTFFYALYFGMLGQDFASICTEYVSNSLGLCDESGIPLRQIGPQMCGVCTLPLDEPTFVKCFRPTNIVRTLACKHEFHDFCIRGWCIIGKKNTCPTCKEKVDLLCASRHPWVPVGRLYLRLLGFLRYLIVWQPLIYFMIHGVHYYFNLR